MALAGMPKYSACTCSWWLLCSVHLEILKATCTKYNNEFCGYPVPAGALLTPVALSNGMQLHLVLSHSAGHNLEM